MLALAIGSAILCAMSTHLPPIDPAPADSDLDPQERWFQSVWEYREETLYRELFGALGGTIHTIPAAAFISLGVPTNQVDPRWLTHGVLECPPEGAALERTHWLYVTSGLSNPWGQKPGQAKSDGYSGLGLELIIETPEAAPWAISTLYWLMAVQILIGVGAVEGELLQYYDRVPLHTSIDPQRPNSPLRNVLVAPPARTQPQFKLDSGMVDLLLCIGSSDQEMEFGRTQGSNVLLDVFKHHGIFPLTDPGRSSVIP